MSSHFFAQITVGEFATVLTILVLIGAAVIVLLSRRREDVHATLAANVAAQKGLLDTSKEQIRQVEEKLLKETARVERLEEELKVAGLEYRQVTRLIVDKLIRADELSRENESLKEENRDLRADLRHARDGHGEK